MIFTQIRYYIEIATIIKFNYVYIEDFIFLFELSQYELKSDLEAITEMQSKYGIQFEIDNNNNLIFYRVSNEGLFSTYYPIFNELYFRYLNNRIRSKKFLINIIVSWTLLSEKEPISTTTIGENIGYTRSGLRDSLKWTRNFFEHYNLKYTNIPHYGIQIQGNEYHKRLALISLNNFIDPRIVIDLDSKLIFNNETPYFVDMVNNEVQKLLSFPSIAISYINSKLLSHYLIIQNNRLNQNFIIKESNELAEEVSKTYEFYCASNIINALYPNQFISFNEILYLAILIITINEENTAPPNYVKLSHLFQDETNEITMNICNLLEKNYGISFNDNTCFNALRNAVSHIVIKHHFNMTSLQGFSLSGKSFAAVKKPLLLIIRNDIKDLLQNQFNISTQNSAIIELIDIIQRFIQSKQIYFPKKHLCIMSHGSVADSLLLKTSIQTKFPDFFYDNIEIIHNPQNVDICSENTIYIVNYLSNVKNGKNIYILDNHNNDIEYLPRFLIENSHLSNAYINKINSYSHNCEDINKTFHKYGINQTKTKQIIRNDILFIINTHYTKKANIYLISLQQKIKNSFDKEIDKIIYVEFKPQNSNIQYFDILLTMFMTKPSLFDNLFNNPNLETLDSYLCQFNII